MDFLTSSLLIIPILSICTLILTLNSRARKPSNLPPGPYQLPIIGNILDLGPKPHQSLAKLARKYGPVMTLKLGSITAVVISSPETAKLVLQKHDTSFSNRAVPNAVRSLRHNEYSMVWLPADQHWRKLRKISKEQMFSTARLDAGQGVRREKLQKLSEHVREYCETGRAVDVGDAAFTTTLNLVSASLFSVEFAQFDSGSSQEIKDWVRGVTEQIGNPNLGDYFPVLKSADLQGISKEMEFYFDKLLTLFDEKIEEKMKSRGENKDLVDALLELNGRDEAEFSRNDIKHLVLDLFVAGTDTTSGTVEWAMAELIHNPSKMSRLKKEVRNFIKENGQFQESDIPRLPYLQAVVKETLRLHPSVPILPHKADSNIEINGYIIPKNAHVLVNVWASSRDPDVWTNAEEFIPERFLNENKYIDFRGQDFELIPFGAGRRICPGLPMAHRMVHQMLTTLVGNFDWKLEKIKPEEMNMDDKFGLTIQKAISLKAIPMKV